MTIDLLIFLAVALVINIGMFFVAYARQTDKLTDISYAVTFVTLVIYGLFAYNVTNVSILVSLMVALWAGRLGGFLLTRVQRVGKDKRFDGMRENFGKFSRFWILQGVTVWVVSLGVILVMRSEDPVFTWVSLVGLAAGAIGLSIQATADAQKYRFKNEPDNKDKWIDEGLWHYSRHPNYFGEILLWTGLWLVIAPSLNLAGMLVAGISPVFIASLLIFASGIPPLEKNAQKRWGSNKDYQAYKRRTSILVPWPPKS